MLPLLGQLCLHPGLCYPSLGSSLLWCPLLEAHSKVSLLPPPPEHCSADPGGTLLWAFGEGVKGEYNLEQISSKQKCSQLLQIRAFDLCDSDSTRPSIMS